jgi:hypothetical protein
MADTDNRPTRPALGQSVTYLGRKLTRNPDDTITSEMKGRDPLTHPNWTRTMDAIHLVTGLY